MKVEVQDLIAVIRGPQMDKLNAAQDKSRGLEWPEPEEIWDYYRRDDLDYCGQPKEKPNA